MSEHDQEEIDRFIADCQRDWIAAGQPGPRLTVLLVREIQRLREQLAHHRAAIRELMK